MPQFQYIDVRFFVQAFVHKEVGEVKKFVLIKTVGEKWPNTINFTLVASIDGAMSRDDVITSGKVDLTQYTFVENYSQPASSGVSLGDVAKNNFGRHLYYSVDVSQLQSSINQYINTLGGQGWELVSRPSVTGTEPAMLEVSFSNPGYLGKKNEFEGGELRAYLGRTPNNKLGHAYSFKKEV